MERWCWVSLQCRGVLQIWIIVGQGPTALASRWVGAVLDILVLICHFFSFSLRGGAMVLGKLLVPGHPIRNF